MSPAVAPFEWILLVQGMSAFSELAGQRITRRCHNESNIRVLTSMACYCSVQAFVVLAVIEKAFPVWSEGQGSLYMWQALVKYPYLWINAANNSVYWLALAFLLREPLGAILVVLSFLAATFLVDPFSRIAGLPGSSNIPPAAAFLGVVGTVLCLSDIPVEFGDQLLETVPCCRPLRRCRVRLPGASTPQSSVEKSREGESDASGEEPSHGPISKPGSGSSSHSAGSAASCLPSIGSSSGPQDAEHGHTGHDGEGAPLLSSPAVVARSAATVIAKGSPSAEHSSDEAQDVDGTNQQSAASAPGRRSTSSKCGGYFRALSVLSAFGVLAVTTGIGVTVTNVYQQKAGLNSFGYAAVDQVLLPFTTLPLAALLDRSTWLRALIGEPPWSATSETPPHFGHTLARTWKELNSGYWLTLLPFHGLEFIRTIMFFWLVTAFDVDATYLTMTLLRIVLVWLVSLLACSFLRRFVGIRDDEATRALHPANLSMKVTGSTVLALSILKLKGFI